MNPTIDFAAQIIYINQQIDLKLFIWT